MSNMDDIHTPTVPSGPVSGRGPANGSGKDQMSLFELMDEKERVESEMTALSGVLDSHGVNMNTTLTTFDGYPRDDLDIAQIRTTRARIIYLRNDYKALMNKIEAGLHAHHASLAAQAQSEQSTSASSTAASLSNGPAADIIETPFAKVNTVVPGSPADQAGLKPGDGVRRFGSVNWINHEKLSKVAEVVTRNEGRPLIVKVQRKQDSTQSNEELELRLTPRRDWGGRGLLGCHLLPV